MSHFLPKICDIRSDMFEIGDFDVGPFPGEESSIGRSEETFVQEDDYSGVLFRSDNSAGCLKDFIHSRVHVGVFITHMIVAVIVFPEDIMLQIDSGDSGADADNSDK